MRPSLNAIRSAHDARYKETAHPPLRETSEVERDIRAHARAIVAGEMKYLMRGNRGEGRTYPPILHRIRAARRNHSASIAREIAMKTLHAVTTLGVVGDLDVAMSYLSGRPQPHQLEVAIRRIENARYELLRACVSDVQVAAE